MFAGLHQPNCYTGKHGYVIILRLSGSGPVAIWNQLQYLIFSILEDFSYYIIWTDVLFFWGFQIDSGVMDDRGKFIYISTEEMKAVAEYIRKGGRVSISHLANNSNQFIDLEPKAQYNEEESLQADGEGKLST
jgi:hypothetical protein